jgi:hypothetical protein
MPNTDRPEYETLDEAKGRGMPRWAKVLLIIAAILVALFVVMLFIGGGHGPMRHMGMDVAASSALYWLGGHG